MKLNGKFWKLFELDLQEIKLAYLNWAPEAHSYHRPLGGTDTGCALLTADLFFGARKDLSISAKLKNV